MRLRKTEEQEVRELLALRPTDDLTDEESRQVDEALVYSADLRKELADYEKCLSVLQTAAAEPSPTDERPSLWKRIEPQLGPARRRFAPRQFFAAIPTPWLTAAVFLLAIGNLYLLTVGQSPYGVERSLAGYKGASGLGNTVAGLKTPSTGERLVNYPVLVDPADARGRVRPLLGISVVPSDADDGGVEIRSIFEGTSAEEAGLQVGDIILEVDGKKVSGPGCVIGCLKKHIVGQRIEILYLRDGRKHKVTVFLGGLVQVDGVDLLIKKSPVPRELIDQQ
jgi:membrane-associated protease RseP (regulator of RpoE activity)